MGGTLPRPPNGLGQGRIARPRYIEWMASQRVPIIALVLVLAVALVGAFLGMRHVRQLEERAAELTFRASEADDRAAEAAARALQAEDAAKSADRDARSAQRQADEDQAARLAAEDARLAAEGDADGRSDIRRCSTTRNWLQLTYRISGLRFGGIRLGILRLTRSIVDPGRLLRYIVSRILVGRFRFVGKGPRSR